MIIQREETVDGTQPPHCSPDTQSLDNSTATEETFGDWSGWPQGPNERLQHHNYHSPQPIELCRQLSSIPELPE